MPGYKLSADGRTCHNRFHTVVLCLYGVCGVLAVVILYYLALLYCRPAYPSDVLKTSQRALALTVTIQEEV